MCPFTITKTLTPIFILFFFLLFSDKFPQTFKKTGNYNRYASRTAAYGTPEIVKRIYTGQLPNSYFNDICYGKRATPREFFYSTPTKERERQLWEPKKISREKTRHVIRDIQDARFVIELAIAAVETPKRPAQFGPICFGVCLDFSISTLRIFYHMCYKTS